MGLLFAGWILWNFTLEAWFQPTDYETIDRILSLAQVRSEDLLYDLGCGDGRIVIRAARKYGTQSVGVEIDPLRVGVAKLRNFLAGTGDRVDIRWGNIYEVDCSDADVIVLFLSEAVNQKLSPILRKYLEPGSKVVSYYHELPGWETKSIAKSSDGFNIYLYRQEEDDHD